MSTAQEKAALQASADMMEFSRIWKIKGWAMKCRCCNRWINIQREGARVDHRPGCDYQDEQHPWARLREILNKTSPALKAEEL